MKDENEHGAKRLYQSPSASLVVSMGFDLGFHNRKKMGLDCEGKYRKSLEGYFYLHLPNFSSHPH